MGKAVELHLKYLGRDSWSRPVYEGDDGVLWKDIDPRASVKANLHTSVGNEFDGEPNRPMSEFEKYKNVSVTFVPKRDVW